MENCTEGNHYPAAYRGRCAHCPFNFKENLEGAQFDDDFTVEHVEDWTSTRYPWSCHLDLDHVPGSCRGAAQFRNGNSDVTEEELINFWVHREPYEPDVNIPANQD